MNERPVIIDTGPLVAYLFHREPNHDWVTQQLKDLPAPFFTCEAVLTETFHFVSRLHDGPERLFEMLSRNVLEVDFALSGHLAELRKLMGKYKDLPMSLADACVVRMSEIHPTAAVLTLDEHFKIYRKHGRQPIKLLIPKT